MSLFTGSLSLPSCQDELVCPGTKVITMFNVFFSIITDITVHWKSVFPSLWLSPSNMNLCAQEPWPPPRARVTSNTLPFITYYFYIF